MSSDGGVDAEQTKIWAQHTFLDARDSRNRTRSGFSFEGSGDPCRKRRKGWNDVATAISQSSSVIGEAVALLRRAAGPLLHSKSTRAEWS